MKIYDMHIHISEGKPEQNFLIEKMDESGVYGGGIISACPEEATAALYKLSYRERLDNLLQWTKNQDNKLFPILWLHPNESEIEEKVKNAIQEGVSAFKIICDTFPVYSNNCLKLIEIIDKYNKPILFHSGILWSGTDTSKFNRPVDWECMLNFKNVKFSMGHCSWPWHDECIAVYGKFLHYYNTKKSSEMFFDITPGTPKIYRRELLTKIFTVGYDVENNIMFGTDSLTKDYNTSWVKGWLEYDKAILDELNITDQIRSKLYNENFLRFLSGKDISHNLPQINK